MIDLEKYRDQIFRLTNEWDVEVMESTDDELREVYEQVASLAKGGEEQLGARDYNELHVAQIVEVMIRWELHLRKTGEELPGVPYDPARTAAEQRRDQARRRAWGEAN